MVTSIQLQEETRTKLAKIKYNLGLADYDEVINKLLNLVTKFKLAKELEEIAKEK